jgi:drug/metabolite transporter (DMT)-like permease
VLFSIQILLLDRYGREVSPELLTLHLAAVSGFPAVLIAGAIAAGGMGMENWLGWTGAMLADPTIALAVVVLTVFSTIMAFYWMNKYQPQLSANRAALIYFLEPLFGAGFSLLLGYDKWSYSLLLGGGLIVGGNLLAEPALWRPRLSEDRNSANAAENMT